MGDRSSELLVECLRDRCRKLGIELKDSPSELCQRVVKSHAFLSDRDRTDMSAFPLSAEVCLPFLAGAIPLLIAPISCELTKVEEFVSEVLRRAAISLTWLDERNRVDLQVFFVSPPGTGDDPEWRSKGQRIERDDRVCRKIIWFPPDTPDDTGIEQDAHSFLARTFLGRPWESWSSSSNPSLDATAGLFEEPWEMEWIRAIDNSPELGDDLAQKLIQTLIDSGG